MFFRDFSFFSLPLVTNILYALVYRMYKNHTLGYRIVRDSGYELSGGPKYESATGGTEVTLILRYTRKESPGDSHSVLSRSKTASGIRWIILVYSFLYKDQM